MRDLITVRRRLEAFLWELLPGVCILCNERSGVHADLCEPCRAALPRVAYPCHQCALPLAGPGAACNTCRAQPPPYKRTIAALQYTGTAIRAIHRLKFGGSRVDARVLGGLLCARIRDAYSSEPLPSLIVPVPLSRARLRRRGHNQSALLARWVGIALGVPVDYQSCVRIRDTPPQTGLSRSARLRNLAGAFVVLHPLHAHRVAVIDDVMTTGTTVAALSRTLLADGAKEVHVWVAARTTQSIRF